MGIDGKFKKFYVCDGDTITNNWEDGFSSCSEFNEKGYALAKNGIEKVVLFAEGYSFSFDGLLKLANRDGLFNRYTVVDDPEAKDPDKKRVLKKL